MEMLIVLLVLAMSEKNGELKETLKNVLNFYRENRELLVTLAGSAAAPSKEAATVHTAEPSAESPKEGAAEGSAAPADGIKLIEEFLKRQKL